MKSIGDVTYHDVEREFIAFHSCEDASVLTSVPPLMSGMDSALWQTDLYAHRASTLCRRILNCSLGL